MKTLRSRTNSASQAQLFNFTNGLDIDPMLIEAEIKVQKAWTYALERAGKLSARETKSLIDGLNLIAGEVEEGSFRWKIEEEDIHMNIERALTEKLGALGKKIHLGRSRNDLIATTLRIHLSAALSKLETKTRALACSIVDKSHAWIGTLLPGLSHGQCGQPVRLAHMFSSHAHAFNRDLKRLNAARKACLEYMPLGSGAFAGTHLDVDLEAICETLGFEAPAMNSYDAVGDRDFILETLGALDILAVHLSRLCEEILFWTSTPVALLKIPSQWSTGSSIMPNKRNPDVIELVRAKTNRVIACGAEAAGIVKAVLPSYGSDLHELKRTLFRSTQEIDQCLSILRPFINGIEEIPRRSGNLLETGHILATEIANVLCEDLPFREAYQTTVDWVEKAERSGLQVHEYASQRNLLKKKISFEGAVELRNNTGGTSREQVLKSLNKLRLSIGS